MKRNSIILVSLLTAIFATACSTTEPIKSELKESSSEMTIEESTNSAIYIKNGKYRIDVGAQDSYPENGLGTRTITGVYTDSPYIQEKEYLTPNDCHFTFENFNGLALAACEEACYITENETEVEYVSIKPGANGYVLKYKIVDEIMPNIVYTGVHEDNLENYLEDGHYRFYFEGDFPWLSIAVSNRNTGNDYYAYNSDASFVYTETETHQNFMSAAQGNTTEASGYFLVTYLEDNHDNKILHAIDETGRKYYIITDIDFLLNGLYWIKDSVDDMVDDGECSYLYLQNPYIEFYGYYDDCPNYAF